MIESAKDFGHYRGLTPATRRALELSEGSTPGALAKSKHPEYQPTGLSF